MPVKPSSHLTKFQAEHALTGEQVLHTVDAQRDKEGFNGVAILTDRRFVFFRTGMFSDKIEPIPVNKITSVEVRRGMMFFEMKVHTSHDSLMVRSVDKDGCHILATALQEGVNAPPSPPAAVAAPVAADPIEQLAQLGKLKDAGIVTEQEFEAKKAELLARI